MIAAGVHNRIETESRDHLDDAWRAVSAALRNDCGARTFDQWLKGIVLGGYDADAGVLRLLLPSPFMARWVESQFGERLLHGWRAVLPGIRAVSIGVGEAGQAAVLLSADNAEPSPRVDELPAARVSRFDASLTFASFVTGDSNALAHRAALAVAQGESRYNPLYIHGSTGQGKTHLLHAIGQAFLARQPGARVLMLSAEKFMLEFVAAMRARDTLAFKARLRSADLLMIDDIQFIAGKESTQEEFLHTVSELIADGRALVITADRAPQALSGIENRIISRLSMGLVADIRPAELPLRLEILRAKAAGLADVTVPGDVLDLLARRISSNVRELEGALNKIVAYAGLTGRAITVDFANEMLAEVFLAHRPRVSIDEIQRSVSAHFHIGQAEMVSARRARAVARPRQIAMYIAKQMTPRSLPEIGRKFGGRDHTTVIHAIRQIEKLRAADRELDEDVRTLMRQLEG